MRRIFRTRALEALSHTVVCALSVHKTRKYEIIPRQDPLQVDRLQVELWLLLDVRGSSPQKRSEQRTKSSENQPSALISGNLCCGSIYDNTGWDS